MPKVELVMLLVFGLTDWKEQHNSIQHKVLIQIRMVHPLPKAMILLIVKDLFFVYSNDRLAVPVSIKVLAKYFLC